jgi:heme exporter protein A
VTAAAQHTLRVEELCCIRDQRVLFKNLNFQLHSGECLQVEGLNGTGKTSLLRILCGLLSPQAGQIYWQDEAIHDNRPHYHSDLLYIGHTPGLKDELSPLQNLAFYTALNRYSQRFNTALEQVGLFGYEDVPVRSLSAGQKRRVALARLWLSDAPLWILDEPLTAIDSDGVTHLEARLTQHCAQGGCIALTSHQTLNLPGLRQLRLQ